MKQQHAVYLAGPMRGIPYFNFPAFDEAERELRASGRVLNLFNPAAVDRDKYGPAVCASETGDETDAVKSTGFDLRDALGADLAYICRTATAVVVLPGWERSKGARAEVATAKALGLDVVDLWSFVDPDVPDTDPTLVGILDTPVPVHTIESSASGEVRVTSSTGAEKGSKPARFDLIPAGPLWQVAELYGKGAEKYAARNWERGYAWSLTYAALCRHLLLWWQGQDLDTETGAHHLASVVFHAFAGMEFTRTHPEFDDRPLPTIPGDPEYDRYRKDTT